MKKRAFIAGLMTMLSTPALAEWSADSIAMADRDRPKVMARLGGELDDPALAAYVDSVGQNLVQYSDNPDDEWHFIILDTPMVNAFALPAGHVFITRGALALAKSEAELAAILAHEIYHVTEEHVETRQTAQKDALIDGALGALVQGVLGGDMGEAIRNNVEDMFKTIGQFSQEQEYAADRAGVFLLAQAGYDPQAQADFLQMMAANLVMQAAMNSRNFDPSIGSEFADHPALLDREIIARELAGNLSGKTNQNAYYDAINGIAYGEDGPVNPVQNQVYTDPESGLSFTVARGWRVQPANHQLNVIGPRGATLVFSFARDRGDRLSDVVSAWINGLPNRNRIGRQVFDRGRLNGLDLASATAAVRYRVRARPGTLQLVIVQFDDRLLRMAGFASQRDDDARQTITEMMQSVQQVMPVRNNEVLQYQISTHQVRRRDTIADLISRAPDLENAELIFRTINGLGPDDRLTTGSLVKLIEETPQ